MTAISTVMNASGKTLRPNERSANLRKNQLEKRKSVPDSATLNTSTGQINNSARRKLIKSNLAVDPVSGNGPELIDCNGRFQAAANLNARLEQMESIRNEILTLLIGTHAGMVAMAGQYLNNVNNGVSPTDLFCLSRSQLSVESDRDNPVNTSAKLVTARLANAFRSFQEHDLTQPDLSEIHQQIDLIASIHFLPILLIDVSKTLLHSQFSCTDSSTINPAFLKRLSGLSNRMVALRSEIVISNLGLIKYLAHQYHPQNMSQEDILQEGVVGLLKAVDRFDHRRQLRFSTYATYWIQQAITRSMSKNDKLVRIPINLSPKAPAVFRLVNSRFIETGHVPSAVELGQLCSLSEQEVSTILNSCRPTVSLDQDDAGNPDAPVSMLNFIEQQQFSSAIQSISESELKERLNIAINSLPEKEACVIRCRYGLGNQTEMTLQDIAMRLQVTRERVRQIQNAGLVKLRRLIKCQLADYLETR